MTSATEIALERMKAEGDDVVVPRRVDHWAYLPTRDARQRFVAAVSPLGFLVEALTEGAREAAEDPFGVQCYRDDPVAVEHFLLLVDQLTDLASELGGEYDGWEAFWVEK
jgi:hypothetical protein